MKVYLYVLIIYTKQVEGQVYGPDGLVIYDGKLDPETGKYHGEGMKYYSGIGTLQYAGNFNQGKSHGQGDYW